MPGIISVIFGSNIKVSLKSIIFPCEISSVDVFIFILDIELDGKFIILILI